MKISKLLAAIIAAVAPMVADAKNVFAHVVVGDTSGHTQATWASDIQLAIDAGIDAFVLNIGYPDSNIPGQIANAFAAAEAANFKLFFSYDYLGGGQPWPATGSYSVVSTLNQYKGSSAYFHFNGAPFVSTFEGAGNSGDWAEGGTIRSQAGNVYFIPAYTSIGPAATAALGSTIQGGFSWDMWPDGIANLPTTDAGWSSALHNAGKTYMMGVSPWFFHSASGGGDWVWRGDNLWHLRWEQAISTQPDFVEIVTWNDYGESHYIGPIHSTSEIPAGSDVYVNNMPHDSWRTILPAYIAAYKGESFTVTEDKGEFWYRTSPVASGSTCGVVGDASYQTQYSPAQLLEDQVFYSALLTAPATVKLQIGNNAAVTVNGNAGINHWSTPFNGQTGAVTMQIVRNGAVVKASGQGAPIQSSPNTSDGCANYNAWVGGF